MKHKITHIWISPYNLQVNGSVERCHYDIREAIMKSCDGEEAHWPRTAHSVFWAEWVTIHKSTGLSPYSMAHGIEPLFPFDLSEATFLVPMPDTDLLSTVGLIGWHARQLQKHEEDLESIHDHVLKAWFASIKQFEATYKNHIKDHNFQPGSLVLIRNSRVEKELNRKTKPRYMGPVVVLHRMTGGSYMLAELDGAVSKLCFAAFCLIPYHSHANLTIPVPDFRDHHDEELDYITTIEDKELDDEESGPSGSFGSD
jgi:hypothetical protein